MLLECGRMCGLIKRIPIACTSCWQQPGRQSAAVPRAANADAWLEARQQPRAELHTTLQHPSYLQQKHRASRGRRVPKAPEQPVQLPATADRCADQCGSAQLWRGAAISPEGDCAHADATRACGCRAPERLQAGPCSIGCAPWPLKPLPGTARHPTPQSARKLPRPALPSALPGPARMGIHL